MRIKHVRPNLPKSPLAIPESSTSFATNSYNPIHGLTHSRFFGNLENTSRLTHK